MQNSPRHIHNTGVRSIRAINPNAAAMPAQEVSSAPVVAVHTKRNRRAGVLILAFCLILAVAITLLVPMIVDGAQPNNTKAAGAVQAQAGAALPASSEQKEDKVAINTFEELTQQAGFVPTLPTTLPEGAEVVGLNLIDGRIAEIEYKAGKTEFTIRMAPGREDISGITKTFAVTYSEEAEGVTRSYSGISDTLLNLCVWSSENNCYAIVSQNGMSADMMRTVAESLA